MRAVVQKVSSSKVTVDGEVIGQINEEFVQKVKDLNINVGTGKFGAHMMVDLTNDGPVTILLESRKEF